MFVWVFFLPLLMKIPLIRPRKISRDCICTLNGQCLCAPLQILEHTLLFGLQLLSTCQNVFGVIWGCLKQHFNLGDSVGFFGTKNPLYPPTPHPPPAAWRCKDHRRSSSGGGRHAARLNRKSCHDLRHSTGYHSVCEAHLLCHAGGMRLSNYKWSSHSTALFKRHVCHICLECD